MGEQDHGDHELTVRLSWCHGVHVIDVSGEVDQDTIEPLRAALTGDPRRAERSWTCAA